MKLEKGQEIKWFESINGKFTKLIGKVTTKPNSHGSFVAIGSDMYGRSYKCMLNIFDKSITVI